METPKWASGLTKKFRRKCAQVQNFWSWGKHLANTKYDKGLRSWVLVGASWTQDSDEREQVAKLLVSLMSSPGDPPEITSSPGSQKAGLMSLSKKEYGGFIASSQSKNPNTSLLSAIPLSGPSQDLGGLGIGGALPTGINPSPPLPTLIYSAQSSLKEQADYYHMQLQHLNMLAAKEEAEKAKQGAIEHQMLSLFSQLYIQQQSFTSLHSQTSSDATVPVLPFCSVEIGMDESPNEPSS